ncbi:hypothetical protein J4449_03130 [Candidatus Woesearchaeota archaeon]|nr:hypothetical protein [Candidatus Woesearchaeota archaeon]
MNIVDKLIDDLILEITGKEVVPLVNLIKNKTDVSEFKIAGKLKLSVNQVRNMLYRLNSYNLVDFTRQKDKTKGWYIYFWTFNLKLAKELAVSMKNNKINILRKRLEKESNELYFVCPSSCVRFDSVNVMEYQFKCPECGKILVKEESKKNVEKIQKEITTIENELKELKESEEKVQKMQERKLEKEREKEKERKLKKKKRLERLKQKTKQILIKKKPENKKSDNQKKVKKSRK